MNQSEFIAKNEARMLEIVEENQSIQARADAAQSALTGDEIAAVDRNLTEFESLKADTERRRVMENQAKSLSVPLPRPSQSAPAVASAPRIEYVEGPKAAFGWRSFGEFVKGVVNAGTGRGIDPRFSNAATTYGTEGTSADGGYALPPDFRESIVKKVQGESSLMAMCEQFVTSSNKITVPLDTATPWQTSGGVLVNWTGEASAITQSKPSLEQIDVQAYKLAALVPLSDELIEDVPAINAWLPGKVGDKMVSALNLACLSGTGTGQPTGIIGSAGEVVVTATASVGKVTWAGVVDMYTRMAPQLVNGAVWLIHPSVLPSLLNMTSNSIPVWLPPGPTQYGAAIAGPSGSLLGRPVYTSEYCSAVGIKGDIIFYAPKTCACVMKTSGVKSDLSIHFFFDQAVTALRATIRIGHKSLYTGAITPKNGALTYGNVVTISSTRT